MDPVSGTPAGLGQEADVLDDHAPVGGLEHVVEGQAGHADRRQGLHLHTGATGGPNPGRYLQPACIDLDGDLDDPPVRDIVIERGLIKSVGDDLAPPAGAEVIDAGGMLAIPGLVNAHYHSHDVLAKGMLEDLALEHWGVLAGGMGAKRSGLATAIIR